LGYILGDLFTIRLVALDVSGKQGDSMAVGGRSDLGPMLWFKNIFAEKISKNIGIFCLNYC
jgi:hypothetical protein